MLRVGSWVILFLFISIVGCGDVEKPASLSSSPPTTVSAEVAGADVQAISPADLDKLRSLGYASYVDQKLDKRLAGGNAIDRERSQPGYNLYSVRPLCVAKLIDADGETMRTWRDPVGRHWSNCELLANGDLLVVGTSREDPPEESKTNGNRYLARYSWDGRLVWRKWLAAHHDVELTPSNELAVLTRKYRRINEIDPKMDVIDEQITLLDQQGTVLRQSSIYDLLKSDSQIFCFQKVKVNLQSKGRDQIDLLHTNSLEWMRRPELEAKSSIYSSKNVLICMRHQDSVAIVNMELQQVVWAWGQGELSAPHDANVLDSGHILIFDNGLSRNWSRVIELDPVRQKIVWQYKGLNLKDFYTAARGSNQRMPNGNTLIAESDRAHAFEVTYDGEIVWEYYSPDLGENGKRATIVRMKRYEISFNDPASPQIRSIGG